MHRMIDLCRATIDSINKLGNKRPSGALWVREFRDLGPLHPPPPSEGGGGVIATMGVGGDRPCRRKITI